MELTFESYVRATQPLIIYETPEPDIAEGHVKSVAGSIGRVRTEVKAYDTLLDIDVVSWLNGQLEHTRTENDKELRTGSKAQNRVTVIVIRNIQFFLDDHCPERQLLIQWLHNNLNAMKDEALVLVGIAPDLVLPEELERVAVVFDARLPTKEALVNHASLLARKYNPQLQGIDGAEQITSETIDDVSSIGVGMTIREFKDALTQSLVVSKTFDPGVIMELKKQLVKKSEILELYYPKDTDSFDHLFGMDTLKKFTGNTFGPRAKGVIIVGVPGCGKTQFAKGLAQTVGVPLVVIDLSSVYDSLVGNSEKRMKGALKKVDRFGRCVLLIDEVEKALGGVAGNSTSDVSSNTMSIFLKWLSERGDNGAYIVATCNDVQTVLDNAPEYFRAGRWDAVFFVDTPTESEKRGIWDIWLQHYEIAESYKDVKLPDSTAWTGAEIETCCRLAALAEQTVEETAPFVPVTAKTAEKKIATLRAWAEGRTVNASAEALRKSVADGRGGAAVLLDDLDDMEPLGEA